MDGEVAVWAVAFREANCAVGGGGFMGAARRVLVLVLSISGAGAAGVWPFLDQPNNARAACSGFASSCRQP